MSRSKGEGRSPAEKQQRVLETPEARRRRIAQLKAEKKRWEDLAGPVTVTKKEDRE